jgi:hypothetical protein
MPDLNWDVFESLPGSATANWESLCRALVRRNYAQFGTFRSVAQQPGIEFHLKLDAKCSLGDPGRHWGWQCRWYELDAGRQIGTTRRKKIEEAIRTTESSVPTLTDWVLWTRRELTPTDQAWYFAISTSLKLHLWAEKDVFDLLVGEAEVLKATYFGDLVLTADKFRRMHDEAVAPIKKRWEPLLHVEVDVERELKAALGVPGTWPVFRETSDRLSRRAAGLQSECKGLKKHEAEVVMSIADLLMRQSEHLRSLADALDRGAMAVVRATLESPIVPAIKKPDLARLAARLRSAKHPASLPVAASIGEQAVYFALLNELSDTLAENFFAVIGDAGFGKTFLAAELTNPTDNSPGGVLLLAKYLPKNGSLNDLARRVPFGGERMEQLIEAVDAAGARAGRRLPIFIDGLNESENPTDWKDLLETLRVQLRRTSNCAVIVTLRSAVAESILSADVSRTSLRGFEHDQDTAIRKYFEYYRIDATDAQLPWAQLSSPLFLSIFCQATNPDRQKLVGPDRIPASLTAVFEEYRKVVVSRAAEAVRMAHQDVESALERVGLELWGQNARNLEFDALREIVGDHPRAWQDSLARVLEEEGVLSRDPYPHFMGFNPDGHPKGNQVSAILYDAFAGFVIADAILGQQGTANFPQWISENWQRLDVSEQVHHPLAEDILRGFVGLFPRRHYCQLWPRVPSPLRAVALLEAANLEAERIDKETRLELITLCKEAPDAPRRDIFYRLWSTRAAVQHPLNADFLHDVLSNMEVADRDVRWTEWIRRYRKEIYEDLEWLEHRWRGTTRRDERDKLLARWVSWNLTSTVRYLRDQATKSLYWYGLGAPQSFFEMVIESLTLNDPYVFERMVAAAYGVVMGQQRTLEHFAVPLTDLLHKLAEQLTGDQAKSPTYHWMVRAYVQGIVDFARRFLPASLREGLVVSDGQVLFAPATYVVAKSVKGQYTGYLGQDFENYEVGHLFDDRGNYDYEHKRFKATLKEIRGRVWRLGYREEDFKEIDSQIGDHYTHRNEPSKTERYAKKYGWIGLYEKAGVLSDKGQLSIKPRGGRGNPIPDIDPSFPCVPPNLAIAMPDWTNSSLVDNKAWLGGGEVVVPDGLLRLSKIGDYTGPWTAVDGILAQTNELLGRRTFGFIRGILVAKDDMDRVLTLLNSQEYLGNDFIRREPSDHYTFACETPWSDEFASDRGDEGEEGLYKARIGGYWGEGPVVEILSHSYAWESYHSSANPASGFSVPSRSFSEHFDLRGTASSFSQADTKGKLAAVSLSPPENFERSGNVLYLREDLLLEYAKTSNAVLVWAVWGERNVTNLGYRHPEWCMKIYERHGHVWRRIQAHSVLRKRPQRGRKQQQKKRKK